MPPLAPRSALAAFKEKASGKAQLSRDSLLVLMLAGSVACFGIVLGGRLLSLWR